MLIAERYAQRFIGWLPFVLNTQRYQLLYRDCCYQEDGCFYIETSYKNAEVQLEIEYHGTQTRIKVEFRSVHLHDVMPPIVIVERLASTFLGIPIKMQRFQTIVRMQSKSRSMHPVGKFPNPVTSKM